ncbi:SPASM domain-containing protein [Candidatus Kaiserbacteria bacterium]|nr:SPASM domain-containing protein [Candidatus Kaiserbacteria bacterium]
MVNEKTLMDEGGFMEYRKKQEADHMANVQERDSVMDSLVTVELNITELCNRKCPFCPRIDPDIYPNRNLNMSLETAEKVARNLAEIDSRCRISFSGFGEPLLHPAFPDIIRAFRTCLPNNAIETNTNGDKLTVAVIRGLYGAGLTTMYVNCYDGPEQVRQFTDLFKGARIEVSRYKLRRHWSEDKTTDFGLVLNNRSGTVDLKISGAESPTFPLARKCFYPFYKMLVDWNGNVLFCSNDWGRVIVVGSVHESSIQDIWLSEKMLDIRKRLMVGDRLHSPCNTCSVNGTLHGKSSFQQILKYYVDKGLLGNPTP